MNPFETIAAIYDGAQPMAQPAYEAPRSPPKCAPRVVARSPANEDGLAGEVCEDDMPAAGSLPRGQEHDDDADAILAPRTFGFDIEKLNEEFALVLMGSKAVIFLERPDALIEDQQRMLTIEAFNAWFANRFTERRDAEGNIKVVTWSKAWMQSSRRRQYSGVEFFPNPDGVPGTRGYLNLWSGFAIAPAAKPDSARYSIFRDHLLINVCGGDEAKFRWVFGFFAQIMQRPRERLGVALVLRGKMGTGKTKVGEVFGSLFPRHYFPVDDPRYVTGNFNAHMAACLLLQADEAVWAGDKSAEGRLKGLITSSIQQIEAKGIDPIRLKNHVRLVMTSNEDWVVPAGKDERRFTVLDVAPHCAKNHQYFREMDEQLADGGLAHLLGDLLAFDLECVNLREVLRTEALLEQKIRSLNSVESWWFERLSSGTTGRHASQWASEVPTDTLFDDYIAVADKIGVKRKSEKIVFGIALGKLLPGGVKTPKRTQMVENEYGQDVEKRVRCYALPPLSEVREHFETLVGQPISWPPESDDHTRVDSLRERPEYEGYEANRDSQ
jgi:Family of unknown function (DUF5906)